MQDNGAFHWVDRKTAGSRPCVSLLATAGWALPDELAMCRRLGVGAVGLSAAKAASTGWPAAKEMIRESGLQVEYMARAIASDPEDGAAWAGELSAMEGLLAHAAEMAVPTVLFTAGPSGQLSWEDAADRLVARVGPLVSRARDLGVVLAIENTMTMRADISFAHTVRDAAALARRMDAGLVADLYCAWQEPGLLDTLRADLDRVRVLQVSDFRVGTLTVPNRWVPGDGDLPIARLLSEALELGYRGVVDLELLGPAIEAEGPESALTRGLEWLAGRL